MTYVEIGTTTNFSFLRGASHPEEYVERASDYGLYGIGIADHNTLAGVVRGYTGLRDLKHKREGRKPRYKPKFMVGTRLVFIDGTPDILVYPRDRKAYGRLCQLLSEGKLRADKGGCLLRLDDLLRFDKGQLLVVMPPHRFNSGLIARTLDTLVRSKAEGVWLGASFVWRGDDARRLARLQRLAQTLHVPLIATNDSLYHKASRRPLQDVLTCIREKATIDTVGRQLEANAERHLLHPNDMTRLFARYPEALAETIHFADLIKFKLSDLSYRYPDEPVPPGRTAQQHLEYLTWAGTYRFFPEGLDADTEGKIYKELKLIDQLGYAHYFLTVHDIVCYARSQNILCQGRGSAANSVVCFLLGITAVNPQEVNLLFERFISEKRMEPPDIDVDFEHNRREEVMQYVYRRYGRQRAAIIATVIHYRPRSAIRDVGKALGLTEDVTAALADTVWGSWGDGYTKQQFRQAGLDPSNPMIARAVKIATELIGFPRHLSQHVGGYVLTQDRLDTYVPIGHAAMDHRTFIEWDKDDVEAVRMMKVDVLALGMLTCIRKCFDLLAQHKDTHLTLATVERDCEDVYDMLCQGESLGVFQVESRAQMNMLPRLKPRKLYDLVIEVAIVRPGPIQGNMVHPYLRRRNDREEVTYPSPAPEHGESDELKNILEKTLGVPLFQEQAMRIALEAAKFTPDEANGLRKAMATFRHNGTIHKFEDKMVRKMIERGYPEEFARNCFNQIKGFGEYGFPESHAASFAILVYISSWLKRRHPEVFACSLLNAQPMGFYAPAQIIRDAEKNHVKVRGVDVSFSLADNTIEERDGDYHALRLGFRQIDGFVHADPDDRDYDEVGSIEKVATDWAAQIVEARAQQPFASLEHFAHVTGLPKKALILLAEADAFQSLGLSRREALWAVRRLPDAVMLPLFKAADAREQRDEDSEPLPPMPKSEEVVTDYQTIRLSIKGHPMEFLRAMFAREGALPCCEVSNLERKSGRAASCAGVVLVRQRPGTAKGVVFMTLEDETGIANVVVWPKVFERYRKEVMGARVIWVEGRVQSAEGVVHLVAERLVDRSYELGRLSDNLAGVKHVLPTTPALADDPREREHYPAAKARHPRNVRILPPSRDFH